MFTFLAQFVFVKYIVFLWSVCVQVYGVNYSREKTEPTGSVWNKVVFVSLLLLLQLRIKPCWISLVFVSRFYLSLWT